MSDQLFDAVVDERDELLAELERLRTALDRVHDRLDYVGAYREGAHLHDVWRIVDEALGSPGRRR